MTMWHSGDQAFSAPTAAAQAGHVGCGASLVDEHEIGWVERALLCFPGFTRVANVLAILLGRAQAFF